MQPIHVSVLALFRVCMQWAEEDIFDTVGWSKKKPFALLALLHFTIRLQVTFLSQFREWFVCFNICIEV